MTGPELERALATCGFICCECFSDQVRLDYAPALGFIPVIIHWPVGREWCPVLSGGEAARLASMDLLDALFGAVTVADGEPDPIWHRRERLAA